MTTELRQIPPVRDVTVGTINRLIVEINKQLDSTSVALGQVQDTSSEVNTIVDQTQGAVQNVIARVPDTYDPSYFAVALASILDRLNMVVTALQTRGIVGKRAETPAASGSGL